MTAKTRATSAKTIIWTMQKVTSITVNRPGPRTTVRNPAISAEAVHCESAFTNLHTHISIFIYKRVVDDSIVP